MLKIYTTKKPYIGKAKEFIGAIISLDKAGNKYAGNTRDYKNILKLSDNSLIDSLEVDQVFKCETCGEWYSIFDGCAPIGYNGKLSKITDWHGIEAKGEDNKHIILNNYDLCDKCLNNLSKKEIGLHFIKFYDASYVQIADIVFVKNGKIVE